MKIVGILLLASFLSLAMGCSGSGNPVALEEMERDVASDINDNPSTSGKEQDDDMITPDDNQLTKAFNSFLSQGVPEIPLTNAFNYYIENLDIDGGLKDSSCLKKPMSETGAISANSSRFDPTTISILKQGIRNKRYIMIIDYTKSNTANRGYLLDLQPDVGGEFHLYRMQISHGYGSQAANGIPQVFTNSSGHGTTVSGFHLTATVTYNYSGNSSSYGAYSSIGLRLYGLESSNNTAEATSKVSHGAPYNSNSRAGNSAGCPAMTQENAYKWLPKLKGGMLWYHHTKLNNKLNYKAPSC